MRCSILLGLCLLTAAASAHVPPAKKCKKTTGGMPMAGGWSTTLAVPEEVYAAVLKKLAAKHKLCKKPSIKLLAACSQASRGARRGARAGGGLAGTRLAEAQLLTPPAPWAYSLGCPWLLMPPSPAPACTFLQVVAGTNYEVRLRIACKHKHLKLKVHAVVWQRLPPKGPKVTSLDVKGVVPVPGRRLLTAGAASGGMHLMRIPPRPKKDGGLMGAR